MDNQQESGFLFPDTYHCASSKHGNHTNHCNSNEEDCVSWEFRKWIHLEYSHNCDDKQDSWSEKAKGDAQNKFLNDGLI